ncbi:MAG: asparagine synthase (glutamine-hydrolyzing) [Flavobacteriaceae bacterium]|nr:MAG: asparagine synthase (glutamine-hydrolyzing) [Flavobacteriaceae bacterium]
MCGIAGIINKNTSQNNSRELTLMTQSMQNRGPDDEGYMLFTSKPTTYYGIESRVQNTSSIHQSYFKKFKLGFGFRQLKIIDLSNNSHQPMTDQSENFWIVFNGEVYNFKEIKEELKSYGHRFFSASDTEVVLKAYMQWGENCLQKFNGMFAIAIFDKTKNEVFMARDRIGIKPFYYHQNDGQFIFASTQKAIIDSTLYQPEINWEGLWQNFRFSIAQRPNTCFKDIVALEPAHFLKLNLNTNKITKQQYWEIPTNTQDFSLTEKQATELLEENLYKAIELRLVADVPIGTFMSGGIDSTTISVLASKIHPNIKTLTLGFKEYEEYNEVQQASDTAKLHNLNHAINFIETKEILGTLPSIVTAYEEPYHHLSANLYLAKMASENQLKVVLSGLGGDELFGGYDVYNKLSLWENLKSRKKIINLLPNIHPKIHKAKLLSSYKNIGEYYSHYYTTYTDAELKLLFNAININTTNTLEKTFNKNNNIFTDNFEAISFYNLKSYIGSHQMRTLDQFTMNYSIEGRIPLLDHNLIEASFKIPTKYKIKNGVQKSILKEVAKKHIAPSCLNMSKKGLRLPLEHWIKSDLKNIVDESIYNLKNRSLFNKNEIDKILQSNNNMKIWQLVSTELWLKEFFK